ncbi:GNAT family N-acetyltransferase [Paenibacillus sp. sgz302251]|uniref:GNAT family N-acetyltransferase n=1 Tax=Paenibacillus sp. sgz302251 TaxID=3414493 RepID=UPI003C7BB9B2
MGAIDTNPILFSIPESFESKRLVGSGGLHRMDWQSRKFEIGYWIRTSFSRQGYMTEAVDAITYYAVQELQANRIDIRGRLIYQQV